MELDRSRFELEGWNIFIPQRFQERSNVKICLKDTIFPLLFSITHFTRKLKQRSKKSIIQEFPSHWKCILWPMKQNYKGIDSVAHVSLIFFLSFGRFQAKSAGKVRVSCLLFKAKRVTTDYQETPSYERKFRIHISKSLSLALQNYVWILITNAIVFLGYKG